MSFPDIVPDLKARMPELRGRLLANQSLAELTWFRVGGPAQVFFLPEDENDLAYFLRSLPPEIPVTTIGAGSNTIVRDGGVPGVVIRLGRGFNEIKIEPDNRIIAGAALLDVLVARAARDAGVAGLGFLSGIPGSIGGVLRMNGGAYGAETKDVLIEARGVDRQGNLRTYSNAEMGFSYRHCGVPDDVIFTAAVFQGRAGAIEQIAAEMDAIKKKREASQPRNRTGGSTFKNPPGIKRLEAGGRGRLPRAHRRRRAGLRAAQQFPHQSRRRQRGRYRDAGRDRARAGEGAFRRGAGMGDQARRAGAKPL